MHLLAQLLVVRKRRDIGGGKGNNLRLNSAIEMPVSEAWLSP